jgi:hypothetical protein
MASKPFPFQCLLLQTGQTTQYSSELDDGYYQTGIAKSYTVLTTGQHSGTTNVDLIHYAAATISFDADTKKILDAANGLAIFKTGDVIVVTGSTANDGVYTIATGNNAAEIVTTEAIPLDEDAGDTVSIAKRESKSNNCVVDDNTGLMWLRDPSNYPAKMGAASDGKMPWTGKAYDIFAYCAAVNVAAVGGYADWRVPNANELFSIMDGLQPNAAAFPNWPGSVNVAWTSSFATSGYSKVLRGGTGGIQYATNATAYYAWLVRGGR